MKSLSPLILLAFILVACAPSVVSIPTVPAAMPSQTMTPSVTATFTPTATATQTLVPTATLPPEDAFMKGLVYYPAGWGGDQRPETDWILKNIVLPTGANWIRLHIACYQDSIRDTRVYCKPEEVLTESAYLHLVETAHSLGLRVMSEHSIITRDPEGYWAGDIGDKYNEEQWAEWFTSYGEMVLDAARLAEKAGTDYLIIVSELDSTPKREKEWRELIAKVREVYHGKISMAFDEEFALQDVQFWDALDAIAVHPYYLDLPGVTNPTVEQLTREFIPYVNRLEALSQKWDRPVIITEIGFWSVHTMTQNYNNFDSSNQIDLQEQTDLFQAVFNAFEGRAWLAGIFWYAFEGGTNFAEPWNTHNAYIGKPAEDVIRFFYGAAPRPTRTPVVFPKENSLPNVEVIYDDRLNPVWGNYPPDGDPSKIDLTQSDISVQGSAIAIDLYYFWTLDFRNDNVDWSKYQWLEFDLFVDPVNTPKVYTIGVTLRDTMYQPSLFKVELLQSQFIEGGKIEPGNWQHVRIPLDVFGPLLSHYGIISIDRPGAGAENKPVRIYVDNVVLRGK
jgi:hypothetical protein